MHTFFENVKVIDHTGGVVGKTGMGSDTATVTYTSPYVLLDKYNIAAGIGVAMVASVSKAITVQMWEASDSTGGGSATLAGRADSATAATASDVIVVGAQVRGEELQDGYNFVAAEIKAAASIGSNSRLGVVVARANPRYAAV